MKNYNVTVRAIITKTYQIEASDKATAELVAHEIFVVENETDILENYEQETMDVEEVKE